MNIFLELLYKVGVLVSISIIAGFVGCKGKRDWGRLVFQGFLFGGASLLGMLNPLVVAPGLIFDGRSIMISLVGFYFGPVPAIIAGIMAISLRVYQGGQGALMGVSVITTSALIGTFFYYKYHRNNQEIKLFQIILLGLSVHITMVLLMFTLPSGKALGVIKSIGPAVIIIYPVATVFFAYVLAITNKLPHTVKALEISQEELKKKEQYMKTIINLITDLIFTVDRDGRYLTFESSGQEKLLVSPNEFIGKLQKDVLPPFLGIPTQEKTMLAFSTNQVQSFEYELDYDGKKNYYESRFLKSSEQEVIQVVRNVTEQKKAEESLRISESNFKSLFNESADAILLLESGVFVDCNASAMTLFGVNTKKYIIGKTPAELSPRIQIDGHTSEDNSELYLKACEELGKVQFEWWHKRENGTIIPVEVMLTLITLQGKDVIHVLARDVRERKVLEQKYAYLSSHDQLTGLYNRYFFNEELIRLDVEENLPFTIVMADVNGLKLVNDSFGHAVGDRLLVKVAEIIKAGARESDIICRMGGDEFILLLPRTTHAEAEAIVKQIHNLAIADSTEIIDISISFGWEIKSRMEVEIKEVLKKAEDYMYKKKLFESPSMRGKTIKAIINALHEKNKREEQHSHRVSSLCYHMGIALDFTDDEINELKSVGLLHDIGKIAIDENILNKPGKLTDEEWNEIERHPEIGYRILSTVNEMSEMAEFVLAHHERWDGKGYPKGLVGEKIPLQARIIGIADAYDAMTSDRSYRNALSKEYAISELKKNAGTQFDPALVETFLKVIENENYI